MSYPGRVMWWPPPRLSHLSAAEIAAEHRFQHARTVSTSASASCSQSVWIWKPSTPAGSASGWKCAARDAETRTRARRGRKSRRTPAWSARGLMRRPAAHACEHAGKRSRNCAKGIENDVVCKALRSASNSACRISGGKDVVSPCPSLPMPRRASYSPLAAVPADTTGR